MVQDVSGNLESPGDYFTAFGIGAAAGAGVGSGISSVLAGTSFWAGFVGSQAAVACPSFATGITVTSTSALITTFLNNFGNGLAFEDKNFGEALWSGFWKGLASAGIAGITSGITSGIIAYRNGTGFWDGFDYQKAIDNIVTNEGINNANSEWLVANKKNIKHTNSQYRLNLTHNKNYIYEENKAYPAVNFGSQRAKTNITLISKNVIRERDEFSLLNVIRHENIHQLQVLNNSTLTLAERELAAYSINILETGWGFTWSDVIKVLRYGPFW